MRTAISRPRSPSIAPKRYRIKVYLYVETCFKPSPSSSRTTTQQHKNSRHQLLHTCGRLTREGESLSMPARFPWIKLRFLPDENATGMLYVQGKGRTRAAFPNHRAPTVGRLFARTIRKLASVNPSGALGKRSRKGDDPGRAPPGKRGTTCPPMSPCPTSQCRETPPRNAEALVPN